VYEGERTPRRTGPFSGTACVSVSLYEPSIEVRGRKYEPPQSGGTPLDIVLATGRRRIAARGAACVGDTTTSGFRTLRQARVPDPH
jgi:hypothetical protein